MKRKGIAIIIILIIGFMYTNVATVSAVNSTTIENKKSANANLSNLGIRPHDFSGFKAETTSYQVTVPEDTEEIEVYATAQDQKAKVSGTGTKKLETGENTFTVEVTSEDGTKKNYKIIVTREKSSEENEGENTEEVQERYSGDGLASLKVGTLELSPKFDTYIYEYSVKYIGEGTKLEIEAKATDPYYTVEVIGNEKLKEGENIINILVSDPDGNNVATYQITVNKSLVDEELLAKEQEEARKKEEQKRMVIIGGSIAIAVILIIIIVLIIKRRNCKSLAEEYLVPLSVLNNQDDQNKTSREKAKEEFLSNYNVEDDKKEYVPKKKRSKGKRFK